MAVHTDRIDFSNNNRYGLHMKCKRHPTYKAIRKPTADCIGCERVWAQKQRRKPMRLKDVEDNLAWVKMRAKVTDRQFQEELAQFSSHAKEVGCKSIGLRSMLGRLTALYDNYHSLLAVADMIENGSP